MNTQPEKIVPLAQSHVAAQSPGRAHGQAHSNQRRVTDDFTRAFHWLFAASFIGAYATADSEHWLRLHMGLGYLMIGLLAVRLVWGLAGPRRVRLATLWGRLTVINTWISELKHKKNIWRSSDLPSVRALQAALMALMIGMLLVTTIPLVVSGYLTNADVLSGMTEEIHEFFGNFYLAMVLTHLAAILAISIWQRRNVAAPMISGCRSDQGPDLIKHRLTWLATALVAASIGWVVYFVLF